MEIELADLLKSLRSEITRARLEAADQDVRFRIKTIELEVHVAVEKTKGAGAGVRFWVVSIGGKADAKSAQTHVVRLSMTAEGKAGEILFAEDGVSRLVPRDNMTDAVTAG